MKNKIKSIKVNNNVILIYLNDVTFEEVDSYLDAFKNGSLFNILRFKKGLIHTMKYNKEKNIISVNTLKKYSYEVLDIIKNYF
jgi:hypothetical protein